MTLVSVNVSQPKTVLYRGKPVRTGIFKEPVQGRVRVRQLNLNGDGQADLSVHGGPDKAVYAYPVEHYDVWARELERSDLTYGQFGENLTVAEMLEETVHIGDVFRIGSTLVEVTQPRVPCYKLGLKMGSARFPKLFLASGRSGYYFRVLEEGELRAGDLIHRIKVSPEQITIRQLVHTAFFDQDNLEMVKTALAVPALSREWRAMLTELADAHHVPSLEREGELKGGPAR